MTRQLRSVRLASKKALKGLNQVAGQRMARGDYATAESMAAKGREVQQFQVQVGELIRAWRALCKSGSQINKAGRGETTPLWAYYQPILRALVAGDGAGTRVEIEAHISKCADGILKPGDYQQMAGGRDRWRVMIHRARKPMRAEGWIEEGGGKSWRITEAGRKAIGREAGKGAR